MRRSGPEGGRVTGPAGIARLLNPRIFAGCASELSRARQCAPPTDTPASVCLDLAIQRAASGRVAVSRLAALSAKRDGPSLQHEPHLLSGKGAARIDATTSPRRGPGRDTATLPRSPPLTQRSWLRESIPMVLVPPDLSEIDVQAAAEVDRRVLLRHP